MRRLIALALLVMTAMSASGQSKVNRGIALDATGAVRVYNLTGSVKITGWNRDSVALRAALGKGDVIHMGGTRSGMKMFVEGMDDRNPEPADLELMVPTRAKVWVKTATAGIEVRDFTGSLDLYVVSGEIRVTGNPTDVSAEAIDGSITITGLPDWVRAKSASGNVTFKGTTSDITATTVSGKVDITGKQFEKAKFETVTGSIRFAGVFERGGLATFDSHSGSIEIGMPVNAGADIDAVSIAGTISNKLSSKRPVAGRYGRGAELNGSVGEGGTRLVVRSFKGPITFLPVN